MLVIPESPGSLAELGSFAANDTIRRALRVIIQDRYANSESFVRYGPIQKIIRTYSRDHIGVYPWRTNSSNYPVVRSIRPHYRAIVDFINDHLHRVHASTVFPPAHEHQIFCVIYWIIYLFLAVSANALEQCVIALMPTVTASEINNKIYCMILAGWVQKFSYSSKDYYYATLDDDPFAYSYKPGTSVRDTLRRKAEISVAVRAFENVPHPVIRRASAIRKVPPA